MWIELGRLTRSILNALLDQYEQPGRRQVVRVRLNADRHHDYFHAQDFAVRREANEALQRLADRGCLRLYWRKWEDGNWLDRVDLIAEGAETVYRLLGRAPLNEQEASLRRLLAEQTPQAGWHSDFLGWARRLLDNHASVAPLKLSTTEADARWNRDLLAALAALAQLREPALERKFSVRLFGDSKRFEDLRGAIIRTLRRHDPESAVFGDDDGALLRAYRLERAPEYVPIAGPLILQSDHQTLDLTPFVAGVAIPATTLNHVTAHRCEGSAVVTVENSTSFTEFIAAKPASTLAIYTGGFASPAVVGILSKIRAERPDLPFFHWGDLDVGGLCILAHLRKSLGEVEPLAMDGAICDLYLGRSQPLNANEREGLMQLRAESLLIDCVELIDHLLKTDRKLEQEAVEASLCVKTLQLKQLTTPNVRIND
ncbi:MAG: DUF2399 domain-containing protein [Chloracidobacterium sp.]|nr:DUF2399 domain-containing protein [Chloracidobacterium sp.]